MTTHQVAAEDAIRAAAALLAASDARNRDGLDALLRPGLSLAVPDWTAWCLAIWLSRALRAGGTDPAGFARQVIADSVAFEARQP